MPEASVIEHNKGCVYFSSFKVLTFIRTSSSVLFRCGGGGEGSAMLRHTQHLTRTSQAHLNCLSSLFSVLAAAEKLRNTQNILARTSYP